MEDKRKKSRDCQERIIDFALQHGEFTVADLLRDPELFPVHSEGTLSSQCSHMERGGVLALTGDMRMGDRGVLRQIYRLVPEDERQQTVPPYLRMPSAPSRRVLLQQVSILQRRVDELQARLDIFTPSWLKGGPND